MSTWHSTMRVFQKPLIVLMLSLLLIEFANGQYHGDSCTRRIDRQPGVCQYIEDCEYAKTEFANGIRPQICSFISRRAIVCCPTTNQQQQTDTRVNTKRISEQKCDEYKKLVIKEFRVGTLSVNSNDHKIQTSDCNVATSLIVGGEKTKLGEYPHMAAIGWIVFNDINFACGGSLISEKFVLTAAHCLRKNGKNPDVVRLGDQNLKNSEDEADVQEFRVRRVIKHNDYRSRSTYNDIGLIELDGTVKFTKLVRPACLWGHNEIQANTGTATGWGLLEFAGAMSEELQKVSLNLMKNYECNPFFEQITKYGGDSLNRGIIDSQLCAAAIEGGRLVGGKDTCEGDSGGPLQIASAESTCVFNIIGITSFSAVGCAQEDSPGVYTRVSSFIDWIESNVWPQ